MDFFLKRLFIFLVVITQENLEVYYEEDEYTMEIISYEYGEDQGIEVVYPEVEIRQRRIKPPPCLLIDFWNC